MSGDFPASLTTSATSLATLPPRSTSSAATFVMSHGRPYERTISAIAVMPPASMSSAVRRARPRKSLANASASFWKKSRSSAVSRLESTYRTSAIAFLNDPSRRTPSSSRARRFIRFCVRPVEYRE